MIWDDEMIKNLLQKYPKIYDIYKKSSSYNGTIDDNIIKSDISRYIIMKEYGGLYFDIEFKCKSTFDDIFFNDNNDNNDNKTKRNSINTIYIASSQLNFWNFMNPFQREKYCSCFMGMDKNHPVWDTVIEKLIFATTKQHIHDALDTSLQQIENKNVNDKTIMAFPIVLLKKVNGNHYQCISNDTNCYKQEYSSITSLNSLLKILVCYYKQIIISIMAVVIIIFVEYLYMHNAMKYGAVNFIPGIPGSAPPGNTILQKKKSRRPAKG